MFEIQTANTVMYVKTKDVLRNLIHVTHLPAVQGQHAHQIVLEIQFVGKIKINVSEINTLFLILIHYSCI